MSALAVAKFLSGITIKPNPDGNNSNCPAQLLAIGT